MTFRVAVVGATGMVGQQMLALLEERNFPIGELRLLASKRSVGRTLMFRGEAHTVQEACPEAFEGIDVALFSAGSGPSKALSPAAAQAGALVIDNSSAFRRDPEVPLVVPEVNLDAAKVRPKGIIANPNCSTIQMLVALAPIHRAKGIKRIVVSTYQAISGAGSDAVNALAAQQNEVTEDSRVALQGQLAGNLLMHWSRSDNGYQEEELKMVFETRKILGDDTIAVSPTCVRVPIVTGHSESIAIETHEATSAEEVRSLLRGAPGIELQDNFAEGEYPQPLPAADTDPVYVGRIRDDIGNPGGVMMWVVSDNLRKGAALNAIQIAEGLLL